MCLSPSYDHFNEISLFHCVIIHRQEIRFLEKKNYCNIECKTQFRNKGSFNEFLAQKSAIANKSRGKIPLFTFLLFPSLAKKYVEIVKSFEVIASLSSIIND